MTKEHGKASPEDLARVRAKIGQKVSINEPPHLTELYSEVRRFNMVGDLTHCKGRIVSTEPVDAASGRARVELQAVDQRGDETASGWAVVVLPRRR